MPLQLFDTLTLDGIRKTSDGYLVANARVARTGVQIYSGAEVGKPEMVSVRVYRPESEVFHKDTLASFAHRPVTLDHPPEMVTADNWKQYAVGQTGGEVARDGECIRVPMVVMDAAAIDAISRGKDQLSSGYLCDLAWEAGKTPDGEAYDAIQKNIRTNHQAVVIAARGGSKLRFGDDNHNEGDLPVNLKKITFDGITIEVTDAGAEVIAKLERHLADALAAKTASETKVAADATTHKTTLEAKDAELVTLKKQLADAAITPAKLRDAARAYATTVAQAKILAPAVKIEDAMDTLAIQKAVVLAKMGDAAKDWNEVQFDTSFRSFAANIPAGQIPASDARDPLRDVVRDGLTGATDLTDAANKAHDEMVKRMESAWKGETKAA